MRDSLIVFVFFAVGVALGYADAVPTWLLDPDLPMIILSVMVVLVGLGLGAGDNLHYMLRTFNWRMLLLPLCTIVGTCSFGCSACWCSRISTTASASSPYILRRGGGASLRPLSA